MSSVSVLVEVDENTDVRDAISSVERALNEIGHSGEVTLCIAANQGARTFGDAVPVFFGSLLDAVKLQDADVVITLGRNEPDRFGQVVALWNDQARADVVIAAMSSLDRGTRPKDLGHEIKRLANRFTMRLLTLEVSDLLSTTRLYKQPVIKDLLASNYAFDDSVGLLVSATARGWKIREIERPFWPSRDLPSPVSPPGVRALGRYWAERNGIHDADYDMRAFNSRVFIQRRWQQRRQQLTMDLVRPYLASRILNVGCGSARINLDLPGAVGVDVVQPKLRYLNRYGVNHLAAASVHQLPFPDDFFDCVVCAEVIEHVPRDIAPIQELVRVLKPGGRLILSTPNYGTKTWPTIEKLYGWLQPGGYADEHVTHYTEVSLVQELASYAMRCVEMRHLYRAVLIGAFEFEA